MPEIGICSILHCLHKWYENTSFYLVEIGLTCRTMSCKISALLTFQQYSYDISAFHYCFQQQDLLRRCWTDKPLLRALLAL